MKHMMRLSMLAAVLLMAMPGSARAVDMGGISSFGINPYIGLGLGVYDLKFSQTGFSQSNNMFGGFVKLGADFNDYLGVQLRVGATEKKKNTYVGGDVELSADYLFSYLAKLQFPITQEFRIYGLAGGTTGKMRLTVTPTSFLNAAAGKTANGASFGGGLDYRVDDFMDVGLEYMRYWNGVNVNPAGYPASKMNADSYTATLKILM